MQPIGIEQVSSRTVEQEKEAEPQRLSRLELAALLLACGLSADFAHFH